MIIFFFILFSSFVEVVRCTLVVDKSHSDDPKIRVHLMEVGDEISFVFGLHVHDAIVVMDTVLRERPLTRVNEQGSVGVGLHVLCP